MSGRKPERDLCQQYRQSLESWGEMKGDPYGSLMIAICLVQLGDFVAAREKCTSTLQAYLAERRFWMMISRPELLVETFVMAGSPSQFYENVRQEILQYHLDPRGGAPFAQYASALLALAGQADRQAADYGAALAGKRKYKLLSSIGSVIVAIDQRDQLALDNALLSLLTAHEGMAKFGEIRESPEGYLCLSAMSLSMMALNRDMTITIDNRYLSIGYLRALSA